MYTRFTYYMSSPARCHVYRVLRQGVGNVTIYRARGEKRRKAGVALCRSSRSLPKSRRKERALALCKVTYIAARAGETERNARIVFATGTSLRWFIDLSVRIRVSRPARKDGAALAGWTATIRKGEETIWYLWKIDPGCVRGIRTCPVDDEMSFRARAIRRGVNTSENGVALLSY